MLLKAQKMDDIYTMVNLQYSYIVQRNYTTNSTALKMALYIKRVSAEPNLVCRRETEEPESTVPLELNWINLKELSFF